MIDADGLNLPNQALEDELEAHVAPPGYWVHQRDIQIKIFNHFKIKKRHRVLEVGTGVMRGGAPLIKYLNPGNFFGVEVSTERFELGRTVVKMLSLEHKRPNLIRSSVFGCDVIKPESIDFLWSFQVVPHMEEVIVKDFVKAIARLLKPGGKALFTVRLVNEGPAFALRGAKWKEFPITNMSQAFLEELAAAEGLKMTLHGTLGEWGMSTDLGGAKNYLIKMARV